MLLVYSVAFASGIASHLGFFFRGEHHMYGAYYVLILFALCATSVGVLLHLGRWELPAAISITSLMTGSFLTGLYLSLSLYRTVFSPLCSFAGPYGARFSDLFLSARVHKQDAFRQVLKYHEQYGEYVRVGSNTLSITNPKAVQAIYGHASKCRRAAWYDLTKPMISLQTIRQREAHDARRRIWSTAFGDKALRDYEERIRPLQDQLLEHIASFETLPFDLSKSFNLYTFDVMGHLAFGRSFGMVQSNKEHWAIELLNEGLQPLAYMLPVWLFRILVAIPGLSNGWLKFVAYCRGRAEERMKSLPVVPDIMSALLQPFEKVQATQEDIQFLHGDSQLIIVAGR